MLARLCTVGQILLLINSKGVSVEPDFHSVTIRLCLLSVNAIIPTPKRTLCWFQPISNSSETVCCSEKFHVIYNACSFKNILKLSPGNAWNMSVAAWSIHFSSSLLYLGLFVFRQAFSVDASQSSLYFVNKCYALKNGAMHHIFDIHACPFIVVLIVLLSCSPQDPTLG